MANFTTSQQLEISEFFQHLTDARGTAELAITAPDFHTILNPIQLGKLIRANFDDYEDIFAMMETYSDEMAEIVDAYWAHRLEQA